MIIGEVLELTEPVTAAENMADKLADRVRNIWLDKKQADIHQWEANFDEDSEGVKFLRCEAFPSLQGIDYIFQWWDEKASDGAVGQLVIMWKVLDQLKMQMYQSKIRFTQEDFLLEDVSSESKKREATRQQFRKAFAVWQRAYQRDIKR